MWEVLVTDAKGNYLRKEQRTPRCHQDFCDNCGDCLSCADLDEECFGMSVPDGTRHVWTMTEAELAEFDAEQALQPLGLAIVDHRAGQLAEEAYKVFK